MTGKSEKPVVAVALTGASGVSYFLRLVARLQARGDVALHIIATEGGLRVLAAEHGGKWPGLLPPGCKVHGNKNIGACLASGSFPLRALVIVPCSTNTLGALASGLAANLVQRVAAVQLKESRKLILVLRETPLSLTTLRGMVSLREAGAVIMPASPGFYQQPQTIMDLVDTVVDRILDHLNLPDDQVKRWQP